MQRFIKRLPNRPLVGGEVRGCATKNFYSTEDRALTFAYTRKHEIILNAYKCQYCSGWHLTKKKYGD